MFFWNRLNKNKIALVDGESVYTYAQLNDMVNLFQKVCNGNNKKISFVIVKNNISLFSICSYLANLKNDNAVCLLSSSNPGIENLIRIWKPAFVFSETALNIAYNHSEIDGGYVYSLPGGDIEVNEDLGLLLSTSGTTGNPKLVRISYSSINENALSIAKYLNITEHDRAITTLPMSYSYGLSIINSFLLSGASIVLNNYSVLQPEFWNVIEKNNCTSLSGVPYTYQMIKRIGYHRIPDCVKTLTQAGGKLSNEMISEIAALNKKFFVMYGQTEATARMSYVPHDKLKDKIGSIGIAIPNGSFYIDDGELVYSGPNVMMGYAEKPEDLALGDTQNSILYTGDLARQDSDGFFYITGRKKRFIKITGNRINLDDVENCLNGNYVAVGMDDKLVIITEKSDKPDLEVTDYITKTLMTKYKIRLSNVVFVDKIDTLDNGKIDYKTISEKYVQ